MHRILLIGIIAMVMTGALLTLVQLWAPGIIPWEFFVKLMITIVVLTVLAALILVLVADLKSNKDLKDKNFLD